MTETTLLKGVDRAVFVSALVAALRRAGLAASVHSGNRLAEALAAVAPTSRTELYWLSRVTLVGDVRDIPVFDRVFDVVFEGGALPTGRDARKSSPATIPPADTVMQRLPGATDGTDTAGGVPWTSAPSVSLTDEVDADQPVALPEYLPSHLAELADRPFDELSEEDLTEIGTWLETVILAWPSRPTRRRVRASKTGRLDLRSTLASARR
ncbi:MAG: CoxE, partial [Acidimicrobiia bacterium]